jgi:thioredoxin-like negative regulator of GroEL
MGNRFSTKASGSEEPAKSEQAQHVKEIAEGDYEAEVATALPVVLDFYATESKACEALAPRFAAVAEKFSGKARFLRILRSGSAALAPRAPPSPAASP